MRTTRLENLIYKMLITSTGSALCDSGGAYGRNWERNQKKSIIDFKNEKSVVVDLEYNEIDYTISVFHYLTNGSLELDDVSDKFNRLKCEAWDSDIYGVSEKQENWLLNKGFEIVDSFNTYNGESSLSQVLQGTIIREGAYKYVLLQIHQGCDVRGGYTDAKMFYLPEEYMPCEDVRGDVTLKNGESYSIVNYYDGINLTIDDDSENNQDKNLYDIVDQNIEKKEAIKEINLNLINE